MKYTHKRDYTRIFDKVLKVYESSRTLSTTNSVGGFYSCLGNEGMDKSYSRAVIPVHSDFICDVELAGKAVLTLPDYVFFKEAYLDQSVNLTTLILNEEKYKRINRNIIETVGREFVRRRIYPIGNYFKAKVVFPK